MDMHNSNFVPSGSTDSDVNVTMKGINEIIYSKVPVSENVEIMH